MVKALIRKQSAFCMCTIESVAGAAAAAAVRVDCGGANAGAVYIEKY